VGNAVGKSLLTAFLIAIIISGFALAGMLHFGTVQAATNVTGIISTDTTWTKANSPYTFTGPVGVAKGVTLIIEPGVTVDFGTYYLVVNGTLSARGSSTDNIFFRPYSSTWDYTNAISFMLDSNSWNEQTGSGSIIKNAVFDSVSIGINGASPKINNNTFGGGYRLKNAIAVSEGSSAIISNNIIDGAGSDSSGWSAGITCGGDAFISGNIVSGWLPSGIVIDGGSPIVEGNMVVNNMGNEWNGGGGIRIDWSRSSPIIRNNTIAWNSVGINLINAPWPVIVNNNIQNNTKYSIYVQTNNVVGNTEHDINATYNWWGTTNTSIIEQAIRDNKDDFNLGTVNYIPFLTEPNPAAPSLAYAPPQTPSPTPTLTPSPSPIAIPTQISISVDASSTDVGSAVNVNGRLSDTNGTPLQDKTVILSCAVAGSTSWVPMASGTTNAAGEYKIQWVNAASGTFTLKAEWNGDTDYLGASNTITLSFLPYENQNVFLVESNSTVSALAFNSTSSDLSFTVSGPSGTAGYVKATIAKSLISNAENIEVHLDENQLNYEVTPNANSWLLTFNYLHSAHQVRINLANAGGTTLLGIEYWMWAVVAIIVMSGVSGFIIWRTKRKEKP
jgi:hypothetical protein